jgi:hypothetical protein
MLKKGLLAFAFVVLCLQPRAAWCSGQPSAPSHWMPQDAAVVLELSQPHALLDLASGPEVVEAVTSSSAYQQVAARQGFQEFQGVIRHLENVLDVDWRTGLHRLVGGGVTLAVCPGRGNLLIVDAEDGQMLRQLHEVVVGFARDEAARQGRPDRVASRDRNGATEWTFGDGKVHAIAGSRLLLPSGPKALSAALDPRGRPERDSLAGLSAYQAARRAAGGDAAGMLFMNLEVLRRLPRMAGALGGSRSPMASLLLANLQEGLRSARWLTMRIWTRAR